MTDSSDGSTPMVPPPPDSSSSSSNTGSSNNSSQPTAAVTNTEIASIQVAASGSSGNSPTSVSSLADALELLSTHRFVVHGALTLNQDSDSARLQRLEATTVEQLESLKLLDSERKEISVKQYHVSVDSVVVTALSTGVAIWAMYVGQIIVTLLSTSATWVQVDPLVVLQGGYHKDDNKNLADEDLLFDGGSQSKQKS